MAVELMAIVIRAMAATLHRGFCLLIKINKQRQSPSVMHPHLQQLLWIWKLTNLCLSDDGLTTLIPSVPLSGNIQQSTHTDRRFNCAKPSSFNVAILWQIVLF